MAKTRKGKKRAGGGKKTLPGKLKRLVDFTKAHKYGAASGLVGLGAAAGGAIFLAKTKKNRKVQGINTT